MRRNCARNIPEEKSITYRGLVCAEILPLHVVHQSGDQLWFELGEIFTRSLLLDVHSPKMWNEINSL